MRAPQVSQVIKHNHYSFFENSAWQPPQQRADSTAELINRFIRGRSRQLLSPAPGDGFTF
jgi:hypothetical protein